MAVFSLFYYIFVVTAIALTLRVFINILCGKPRESDNDRDILNDRQDNSRVDETGRDNRYNDIFFIEPNSVEAARIRAQLEKDDKDLPSYEEVMRMTNLATPTAAPATNNAFVPDVTANSQSSTSVNTTDTALTVPPYTETGANSSSSSPRPLTPPPYTPEPPTASTIVLLPITTPLHLTQTQTQNS